MAEYLPFGLIVDSVLLESLTAGLSDSYNPLCINCSRSCQTKTAVRRQKCSYQVPICVNCELKLDYGTGKSSYWTAIQCMSFVHKWFIRSTLYNCGCINRQTGYAIVPISEMCELGDESIVVADSNAQILSCVRCFARLMDCVRHGRAHVPEGLDNWLLTRPKVITRTEIKLLKYYGEAKYLLLTSQILSEIAREIIRMYLILEELMDV